MRLHILENRKIGGYTTFGSVWGRGEVGTDAFRLTNEEGKPVPVQSRITAWWPDGSVKWAAHTADSSLMGSAARIEVAAVPEKVSDKIRITHQNGGYDIDAGHLSLHIPAPGSASLAADVHLNGDQILRRAFPVFWLERRSETADRVVTERTFHQGSIDEVELEETGPLQCVVRFKGRHIGTETPSMPFVIRMYIGFGSNELRFVHTFHYDGEERRDFLGGMGICFDAVLSGEPCNRHVQFATEGERPFHECATMLASWIPRVNRVEEQLRGELLMLAPDSEDTQVAERLPVWNRYVLCQDSDARYHIRKRTGAGCCALDAAQGHRAPGVMAVNGENGGLLLGVGDFWQKHPAGLEAGDLAGDATTCTAWFYSPEASAMDFRHYDTRSYPLTSYEGFDFVAASAYGIAVTSECTLRLTDAVPAGRELAAFARRVQKPPIYVGDPTHYHEKRALGFWGLPETGSAIGSWLEEQIDRAVAFYRGQVEQRGWYGLFNYGDVMHTYDGIRHCWKYDVGGYAWDNTELVPTYWLWLQFLRTGREDVFTLAEAMSRHCSEVDIYHFGPLKGIGSRHNVRHWGCSCKEPRIAMAGHHRPLYYLTGDRRVGDVLDEVTDGDQSIGNTAFRKRRAEGQPIKVRTGPDWSSFVSNWMTRYERTLDDTYRQKIRTGIKSIAKAPLRLISGPSFYYDPEFGHMAYAGEEEVGDSHLQLCMGAVQIWTETADLLEDEHLKQMIMEFGRFYYLSDEEKQAYSKGILGGRQFNLPLLASGLAAYAAKGGADPALAKKVWGIILGDLYQIGGRDGFAEQAYDCMESGEPRTEIPWITTNFAAQWCLNVILTLEFIPEALPTSWSDAIGLIDKSTAGKMISSLVIK